MQVVMLYIVVSRKGIAMDINQNLLSNLSIRDREFLMRIYAEGLEKYEKRIRAINFVDKQHVLDAGCGFGQWSMALAKYNKNVKSIEIAKERVDFCQELFAEQQFDNISIQQGSIETLPYNDNIFECVFCYGVMILTNWKESLKECLRVLSHGGMLYICTNDVGWYYNMIINEPNKTIDYNPRENAIQAFINEWRYMNAHDSHFNGERIMRAEDVEKELKKYDCAIVSLAGEGKSILNPDFKNVPLSFFQDMYYSCRGVYELIIKKGCV